MKTRYEVAKTIRDWGVSAVAALDRDKNLMLLSERSFLEACRAAMSNLSSQGLGPNRGRESWDCDKLAFAVWDDINKFHALNTSADAAAAVGVFIYEDEELNGWHAIVFGVVEGNRLCCFDPTTEREKFMTPYEKGTVLTYVL